MELVGEPIHSVGALLRQWTQAHRQKYWRWLDFRAKKLTLVTGWQGLAVSRHARWSNQYLGTTLGRREAQTIDQICIGPHLRLQLVSGWQAVAGDARRN